MAGPSFGGDDMTEHRVNGDRSWGLVEALPPPPKETQVAVVDRDALVRQTLKGFVDDLGYASTDYVTVSELWASVQRGDGTPNLIVTELAQNGHDPRSVLFQLHRARPWVPVLLTDSCGLRLDAAEAVACGVHAWLRKPVRLAELELLLHRMGTQIAQDPYRDEATGLHNRRGFFALGEQHLRFAVRSKRELAFLGTRVRPTDPEGLLLANGAAAKALAAFSTIAEATFRDSDIVARTEGQSLGVLLLDTPGDGAHRATNRLISNVIAWNCQARDDLRLAVQVAQSQFDPAAPCSLDQLMAQAA